MSQLTLLSVQSHVTFTVYSAKPSSGGETREDKQKSAAGLASGGKSNSTSSLNLSQIL